MFNDVLSQTLRGQKLELSLVDRSGKIANFHAAEEAIVAALGDAAEECAHETHRIAYELCPVDTGFMRDHLEVIVSPGRQVFEIGWRAADFFAAGHPFYPMFVVLGTRFQPPNDPLTPAHEATKARYAERMRETVQRALDRRRPA